MSEKLDNWIKKIKVYCRVKRSLATLQRHNWIIFDLGGKTLIRWEIKTQVDLVQQGTINFFLG
jgi:hypothetical protein